MPTLFIAVVFALVGSVAQADTSRTHEVKDHKTYGNCHTFTQVDLFTDEEFYTVGCFENTLTDTTVIGIQYESSGLYVLLSKGLQFHLDDQVPVMIRIDKGEVIRRSAHWHRKSNRAFIQDADLARHLLHDLSHGQRAILKVGDEGGNVQLDGAAQAIADFRHRAGLPAQQTLTPQQRQTLEIPARQF